MNPLAFPRHPQAGMTLVEILVTLVILSTGLLAVAQLQIGALRHNHSAYLASLAAQQAQDLAERMRANPAGVAAAAYLAPAAVVVDCAQVDCTPDQLAGYDLDLWHAANQRLLPDANGQISDLGQGRYRIAVRWRDLGLHGQSGWAAGSAATAACGTPQPDLRCFVLSVRT